MSPVGPRVTRESHRKEGKVTVTCTKERALPLNLRPEGPRVTRESLRSPRPPRRSSGPCRIGPRRCGRRATLRRAPLRPRRTPERRSRPFSRVSSGCLIRRIGPGATQKHAPSKLAPTTQAIVELRALAACFGAVVRFSPDACLFGCAGGPRVPQEIRGGECLFFMPSIS